MEKIKVKALDTYEKEHVIDKELNIIPKAGNEIEISKGRLKYLLGANEYKKAFVEKIKPAKKEGE
nr:MAG TPA: hypothetical protein [Caudoviricetes sp.]